MDGVSTAFGVAKSAYDAYKTVKTTRKEFKRTPEKLQLLEDDCDLVGKLLNELSMAKDIDASGSDSTSEPLEHLQQSLERRSDDLDQVISKVTKQSATSGDKTGRSVRLFKFLLNKDDIKDASSELKELREVLALRFYMNHTARVETSFEDLQTRFEDVMYKLELIYKTVSLPQVTAAADEAQAPSIPPTTTDEHSISSDYITHTYSRPCNPLHCLANCHCRCHSLSMQSLIPAKLASYIGQIYVSRRLLRAPWSTWSVCNVQTCRGDVRRAMTINWILPPSFLSGCLQSSRDRRIHFSIGAARTIQWDAPILHAISEADVQRVRSMFALGQASIWDHTLHGSPILWSACNYWALYPSEERYKIIQFLVAAGSDALLLARPTRGYSAQDEIAFTLFQSLLEQPKMGQSLLTSIKSHPAAIYILRSIFNMDALDALQEVLSCLYGHSDEDALRLLASLETTEYAVARSSVFDAISYTPLRYAIYFSPSSVESLLAEGADAAAEPTLAYTVRDGSIDLIELLIDKGADVNMKYEGRTALHWACYYCNYNTFFELVRCAEGEIDWDARTPEGQNALDLFEMGVSEGRASYLTSAHLDEFRSILVSHIDPTQLRVVEDVSLDIPGAFPLDTES